MELSRAVETIEYKIATEKDSFDSGRDIRMDVTAAWPEIYQLTDALAMRYPFISLEYDYQANDIIQLVVRNQRA